MTSSQVTASSSLDAIAAAAGDAARAALHTLSIPGRQRHSKRAQKARPKFPHATATKVTITGKPQVTVFAPGFSHNHGRSQDPAGRRNRSARRGRGPWNRAPSRRDTRAKPCPHPGYAITEADSRTDTEHEASDTSEHHKHLKSLVLRS